MPDSTGPHLQDRNNDQVDRYARGELTAAEARELAQKSLGDPELFEELTHSALAKAALAAPSVGERLERQSLDAKVVRFPRKARVVGAGVAAAAAIVLISLYSAGLWPGRTTPALNESRQTPTAPPLKPALASSAEPGQPVLLARDLQPRGAVSSPVFRSAEPPRRSPRPTGSIVSLEEGLAAIDLGSLDGLAKGSELQIFRDERSTQPIGRLVVATVFRERARGRIVDGQEIQARNQVRVADQAYLGALLEQVDALSDRGDSDAAKTMAEKAVGRAETSKDPNLGALASVALNTLAVLRLLSGDYDGAETPLNQAISKSPKTNIIYGRSLNNLAVLAELRGDRRKAEALYADALRAFESVADSPAQERRMVETNLARIKGLR